jgi:glycosyltransferase involved in cell wall biosynthesis
MTGNPTPVVSILIPAYDAEATLPAALKSVRRQTEEHWECIVVDDGSTDETPLVVESVARHDRRVRWVVTPHQGLVAALNTGLSHCRGRYVARMDADDLMHRKRLSEQIQMMESAPELDAVGCHVRLFPRRSLGPGYREYEAWLNGIGNEADLIRELFVECPVAHPTLLFRSPELLALGYRDCGWPEDYDLILRLVTGGGRIGVLPRRRLGWRLSSGRLSLNDPAYTRERFTACKAEFLASAFLARVDAYILWGHGGTGRALRRALADRGKRASHIIEVHPGRLGNRIHGAPVVPPAKLPELPRRPVVVSVARPGPRSEVRSSLASMGFVELRDFVCCA